MFRFCVMVGGVLFSVLALATSVSAVTFTTIDNPLAGNGAYQGTFLAAIDGGNIVGSYVDVYGGGPHGFLLNGSTFTPLNGPSGATECQAFGIDGSNVVGQYSTTLHHGFLYNGSSYTTIDDPLGVKTFIDGIDGNTLVGYYIDSSNVNHGFVATVPEPSTFILLGLGAITLLGYAWRRRKRAA